MQKKLFLSFSLLLLSSCSYTPWQEAPLSLEQVGNIPRVVQEMQNERCGDGFDADAIITLTTKVGNHLYQGYLAALRPGYGKFVISSPLGQPLFIATTASQKLTIINISAKNYSHQAIPPLLKRYDLPQNLFVTGIANILGAYISQNFTPPFSYYRDKNNRGIWVQEDNGQETLLINPEKKQIIARRIVDNKEQLDIEYSYGTEKCSLPKSITISGLSYGSTLAVELKKGVKTNTFTPSIFTIQPPSFFQEIKQ